MQQQPVYDWRLRDQEGHTMLKCPQILSLSEGLRQIFVMFAGGIPFSGIEFPDGIQGSRASVFPTGCHARTRSDDMIYGLPNDLGDGRDDPAQISHDLKRNSRMDGGSPRPDNPAQHKFQEQGNGEEKQKS